MAKYYGKIGYFVSEEVKPGVWKDNIIEKDVKAELVRVIRNFDNTNKYNPDINVSNQFSIVANPYALSNYQHIRYFKYLGTAWTVKSVEVQYPRLLLNLGGVYNG